MTRPNPDPDVGYDDFIRGGVPGVEGKVQTRLGTWVRVPAKRKGGK
jgi:hypothetical protein